MARDAFGALICVGVFSLLLFQIFQNVGMNLRLMPITGAPLPFVSYGGSSLITGFVAIGLVQSVAVCVCVAESDCVRVCVRARVWTRAHAHAHRVGVWCKGVMCVGRR